MKVLLIGGGGREHALGWKIAQSPNLSKLYLIPGNTGLNDIGESLPIADTDIEAILAIATEKSIDLVIVGPENPLAMGIADKLAQNNIPCFGPTRAAALLESSKGYMKDVCKQANIPTAGYQRFSQAAPAKASLDSFDAPFVIKADGLAAGKGVIIAHSKAEAINAIDDMFDGAFGESGHEIVIEEFMEGEEVSFFAICDGETVLPLMAAQDHKRVGEGDTGPNTGGMGAYAPPSIFTDTMREQTLTRIINPTIAHMQAQGAPFCGVLFAGLMITDEGPKLIEYNVRFGDPECQILMRLLGSDLLPVLHAAATGTLKGHRLKWSDQAAALIVLAAKGYPGAYQKGSVIQNLEKANALDDVVVFHAGTKVGETGQLTANGGRVLNITATAPTVKEALDKAYQGVDVIDWPEGFCRRDIGWRALKESS